MASGNLGSTVLMNAQVIAKAGTAHTGKCTFRGCAGNSALVIITTAGTITVTQEVSVDGDTWYDAKDSAGASLDAISVALGVTAGTYVPFNPVMAEWTRFKVVEANVAETTVTLRLIYRQEV